MLTLRVLAVYTVVMFLGAELLAPWLYAMVQATAKTFPHLAAVPFHRFVNRSLLILALAGLWPLLRALGLMSVVFVRLPVAGKMESRTS